MASAGPSCGDQRRNPSVRPTSSQAGREGSSLQQSTKPGESYITVNKISFDRRHCIGIGAAGTRVFRGWLEGEREVAVKRMLLEDIDVDDINAVKREVKKHIDADQLKNVVRYFCTEEDFNFYYIALELCLGNVDNYVKRQYSGPPITEVTIMKQVAKGLDWLHSRHIVHRDIKPQNILLAEISSGKAVAKITDFGISKKLSPGRVQVPTTSSVGTYGWMAPELAVGKPKTTSAMDVFSSGCVFFYLLSRGKHPFGDDIEQQTNIRRGEYSLSTDITRMERHMYITCITLIERMIHRNPEKRPSASDVLGHPLFWKPETRMTFYQVVSDRVKDGKDSGLAGRLNERTWEVIGGTEDSPGNWKDMIDKEIDRGGFSSYNDSGKKGPNATSYTKITELLRAIRNKLNHMQEPNEQASRILGKTQETMSSYWAGKFPLLLMYVWRAVFEIRHDEIFRPYYSGDYFWKSGSRVDEHVTASYPGTANIYDLPDDILRRILLLLGWRLLGVSRVSRRWRDAVNGLVEACRERHHNDLNNDSVPSSNLHLLLMLRNNPDMTELNLQRRGQHASLLDLDIVSNTCHRLTNIDLRQFSMEPASLERLVAANSWLARVTMPAASSEALLESLLRPRPGLKRLTAHRPQGSGRWLQQLPPSLLQLDIRGLQPTALAAVLAVCSQLTQLYLAGLEAPLETALPSTRLPGLNHMDIRNSAGVTDVTLSRLPDLLPDLTWLNISGCGRVTDGGLAHLGRLAQLASLQLFGLPSVTDGGLDSLHSCSGLKLLVLGQSDQQAVASFTAAGLSRLVRVCLELRHLLLWWTPAATQEAVDALQQQTVPGRHIVLGVPGSVSRQLRVPPPESWISVGVAEKWKHV